MLKIILTSLFNISLLFIYLTDSTAQSYVWAKSIGGLGNDEAEGITSDITGNVFITGAFWDITDFDPGPGIANLIPKGNYDIFFAKYDANGNYLWAHAIVGKWSDFGRNIITDASANVYIIGEFQDTVDFDPGTGIVNLVSAGSGDIFFAKYDSSGNFLWAKSIGGTGGFGDDGYGIAIDSFENVYLIGFYSGTADFDPGMGNTSFTAVGFTDIFFAKYNSLGNFMWAKSIGSIYYDRGFGIALDPFGNSLITGYFNGTADFDPGAGIVNLTPAGGPGNNNVFFGKYDTNGNYLWAKNIGITSSPPFWGTMGYGIVSDISGNVYITGYFGETADFDPGTGIVNLVSAGNSDIFFAKYDPIGNFILAKSIGSTSDDYGRSIITDNTGNIYIIGYFSDTADFNPDAGTVNLVSSGMHDIFFAQYDTYGNYLWAKSIGSMDTDWGLSICIDIYKNVLIAGFFKSTADFDPGTGTVNLISNDANDIFFAKYSSDTIINSYNNGYILNNLKISIFQNPFTDKISVEIETTRVENECEIKILNILGIVIKEIIIPPFSGIYKMEIDMDDWAKGIYLLQMIERAECKNIKTVIY